MNLTDPPDSDVATSLDFFLGDRLRIEQPVRGYRAGLDAVLLAAKVSVESLAAPPRVLDCGSGVGTVGLCIAARLPGARITLFERQPALVRLAGRNVSANGLDHRVVVRAGDILDPQPNADNDMPDASYDWTVANPPYHDEGRGTPSPVQSKALSHAMPSGSLDDWLRFMSRMTVAGGRAALIYPADALHRVLSAFDRRFGAIDVIPILPRASGVARRVLVVGVKGSRAPLTLRSGLALHGPTHDFLPEIEAVLRHGAALPPSNL